MEHLRQGEILFEEIDESHFPSSPWIKLTEVSNGVIREGEKSGHKHQIKGAKLYSDNNGNLYIKSDSASAVVEHPEHKPLKLNKKYYKVEIQREYDEAKHSKNVLD